MLIPDFLHKFILENITNNLNIQGVKSQVYIQQKSILLSSSILEFMYLLLPQKRYAIQYA